MIATYFAHQLTGKQVQVGMIDNVAKACVCYDLVMATG